MMKHRRALITSILISLAILGLIGCQLFQDQDPVTPGTSTKTSSIMDEARSIMDEARSIANFYAVEDTTQEFLYRKASEVLCLNVAVAGEYLLKYTTSNGTFYIVFRAKQATRIFVGFPSTDDVLLGMELRTGTIKTDAVPLVDDGVVTRFATPGYSVNWDEVFTLDVNAEPINLVEGGGECPPPQAQTYYCPPICTPETFTISTPGGTVPALTVNFGTVFANAKIFIYEEWTGTCFNAGPPFEYFINLSPDGSLYAPPQTSYAIWHPCTMVFTLGLPTHYIGNGQWQPGACKCSITRTFE